MIYHLRKIDENDLILLFNWRNHPKIRNSSFDKKELILEEHKQWFNYILKSGSVITYVLETREVPVGAIRFDIDERKSAKINYLIDPSQQGKGLGTKLLSLGIKKIYVENSNIQHMYGYVFKKNLASIRIFEKLSFKKVFEDSTKLKFEKQRNENRK